MSAVALLLTAFAAGCGGDDTPSSSSDSTPTATTSGSSSPVAASPVATSPAATGTAPAGGGFGAVRQAFSQVRSYRAMITSSGGAPLQMTVEVQVPDRYRATISAGPTPIEVIGVGNQTYVKLGPIWQAAPASSLPVSPATLLGQTEFFLSSPQVTQGGTSSAGGASCQIYTVTPTATQSAEMCISSDNLPRQLKYTDAAISVTVVYSDYNTNLNIQAPI
jgi:hypothetical protein